MSDQPAAPLDAATLREVAQRIWQTCNHDDGEHPCEYCEYAIRQLSVYTALAENRALTAAGTADALAAAGGAQTLRDAADAAEACRKCEKRHERRPHPDGLVTWADPGDSHAYWPRFDREVAEWLRARADAIDAAAGPAVSGGETS